MSDADLDDPTKICIHLPKSKPKKTLTKADPASSSLSTGTHAKDYILRFEAYRRAWTKCLGRVQDIVRELRSPVVSAIVTSIQHSFTRSVLPGLPRPELPVIAISAPGENGSIIAEVISVLQDQDKKQLSSKRQRTNGRNRKGKERMVDEIEPDPTNFVPSLVGHIHPQDCPNLISSMKAVVGSFVELQNGVQDDERFIKIPEPVRRRATASLASYDIQLLEQWYKNLQDINDTNPTLILVVHDFEKIDPSVMQDVFYICSKVAPRVPLLFVLDSAAPSPMAYLHAAYSRATLSLLRVNVHTAPSGLDVVSHVIEKTFFDPEFEPDVMLGPATLDYLSEICSRHSTGMESILTIFQLAHVKHFAEPLTAFVQGLPSEESFLQRVNEIRQGLMFPLLDVLLTRIWSETMPGMQREPPPYITEVDWKEPSVEALLNVVEQARVDFQYKSRRMRIGYQIFNTVQAFMRAQGYKTHVSTNGKDATTLEIMGRVVRGRLSREIKYLSMMVKKLPDDLLENLLSDLFNLFDGLPSSELREEEAEGINFIEQALAALSVIDEADDVRGPSVVSASAAEWLLANLEERIIRLDLEPLAEIWSTGTTPFPNDLINPAPRAAMVNALLHPQEVIRSHAGLHGDDDISAATSEGAEDQNPALWKLPDTSILFRRYMEAGRMINVYDWFESFAVALDTQRDQHDSTISDGEATTKGKEKETAPREPEGDDSEPDDEQWRVEVQSRFIRALHELDYMGFIRHTGRKADHILRTVYDVPD